MLIIDGFAGGGGASTGIEAALGRGADGKRLTKAEQIRMVGNSVCPPLAEALVRANCKFLMKQREVA